MPPKIRLDIRLTSLLAAYPNTRQVFEAHGLGTLVSEETLSAIGQFLTLETALLNHGVSADGFLNLLKVHQEKERPLEAPDQLDAPADRPGNLLALMTCGLKFPFAKALTAFINDLQEEGGQPVTYSVVSNLNHEHAYYPYVNHIKSIDDLPDIIVSSDFNAFFYHRFYKTFVQPGHFVDVMDFHPNAAFKTAGLTDPRRQYTMLCVNPLIIVADLEKIGGRPLPACWADLLNPVWHRSITLRGNEHFFCHAVLLPFFKEHGPGAMKALADNVYDGRHPAQMVKSAGNGQSAALYVMPYFFARKIPSKKPIKLIWPKDGALASPVALLVKKKAAEKLKPIIDYLLGAELAQIFTEAYFPSPHPSIKHPLPENAALKWLGWDYIHENDLEAVNADIDRVFLPAVQRKGDAI